MREEREPERGVISAELSAWFSALLFFVGTIGVMGYLVGSVAIAPLFLDDGLVRHGVGAVVALMSLLWVFKRWQIQVAFLLFWSELAVYFTLLFHRGVVCVVGYLAGYFIASIVLGDGLVRHCMGVAVALVSLRWIRGRWRTLNHKGEAEELLEEAKGEINTKFGRDLMGEYIHDYFVAHILEVWRGQRGVRLWLSALKFVFFERPLSRDYGASFVHALHGRRR